jgi:UDP-N-acetylglucosamine 2-epimerase
MAKRIMVMPGTRPEAIKLASERIVSILAGA